MPQLALTPADDGKSFEVDQGDVVVIGLDENPTTGYRWAVDRRDADILELQGSDFSPGTGAGIGGGGRRTLVFKARKAGTARVQLKLWRDWEGESSTTDRYAVTLRVRGR